MIKEIRYILLFTFFANITFSQTSISVTPRQDTILIGDHLIVDVVLSTDNINDIESIDFSEWKSITNLAYSIDTVNLEEETDLSFIRENDWGITDGYLTTPVNKIKDWFQQDKILSKPITISIYDLGFWSLPPPIIKTKSGTRYPQIEPAVIAVFPSDLGVAQDSVALMPIKDIIEEGESWEDYKLWFYILGFILLAPLLIKLFWGRKKEEVVVVEKEVFIPAHQKALSALQSLQNKELWQNGNIKEYQSELTDIVRKYLGDRFDVNALEMTTDEINRELRNKDFDTKHSSTLKRILTIADLVKFAKATPPVEINAQFMDEAVAFVESTKKEITESEALALESSIVKNDTVEEKSRFERYKLSYKKWINIITSLVFAIALIAIGALLVSEAFSSENNKRKNELQQLIANGSKINGELSKDYKESTVKIGNLETVTNTFEYSFEVQNIKYSGSKNFKDLPSNSNVSVVYLESDPSINSINPDKELAEIIEKSEWSSVLLGIAIMLAGIFLLAQFYRIHKKRKLG